MELLYLPVRGRGEALHMIAAYGRVPLKKVDIPLAKWPDLKSTIPTNKAGKQQLPVLRKEDGSLLPESHDIAVYLATKAGPPLMPAGAAGAERAAALWSYYDADDKPYCGESFKGLFMLNPLLNWFPVETADEMLAAARPHFPKALACLEAELGEGPFFAGDLPCYADFALFHLLDNMRTLDGGEALAAAGGRLRAFYEAVSELPGVKEYLASRPQPGTGEAGKDGSIMAARACPTQ
eukprot:jgi/Tetstr1/459794/TSEL_005145.t1